MEDSLHSWNVPTAEAITLDPHYIPERLQLLNFNEQNFDHYIQELFHDLQPLQSFCERILSEFIPSMQANYEQLQKETKDEFTQAREKLLHYQQDIQTTYEMFNHLKQLSAVVDNTFVVPPSPVSAISNNQTSTEELGSTTFSNNVGNNPYSHNPSTEEEKTPEQNE